MYLTVSLAKINVFITLLGTVLLCLDDDDWAMLPALQGLILIQALVHFILLVASHMSTARCSKSSSWRLIMVFNQVLQLGVTLLLMSLTYWVQELVLDWYMFVEAGLVAFFVLYEGCRTYKFEKADTEGDDRKPSINTITRANLGLVEQEAMLPDKEQPEARFFTADDNSNTMA